MLPVASRVLQFALYTVLLFVLGNSVSALRPFATMTDSDAFVYAPSSGLTALYATRVIGTTITALDIPTFIKNITTVPTNCIVRLAVCCSTAAVAGATSNTSLTCAKAQVLGQDSIVAVDIFPSNCVPTTWAAVDPLMMFTGKTGASSGLDMAVDTATSATAGWVLAIIVVLIILIVVACSWRRKALKAANTVDGMTTNSNRRQLPELRRPPAQVVYAEVPRPGTVLQQRGGNTAASNSFSPAPVAPVIALGNLGAISADDVEMRPMPQMSTRSHYGRVTAATSGALAPPTATSTREDDPGAAWGAVVPSTSLFGSQPNSPAPAPSVSKGDDFWAA